MNTTGDPRSTPRPTPAEEAIRTEGPARTESQWWLLGCIMLAIALRGMVVWAHADELTRDRDAYWGMARCLAEGRGFVDADRLTPTAFRPPLYPIQLAGLMLVLPAAAAVAVGNLVWGAVTVWATWRAGHSLGLGRGRALAALLVAIDPLLLQYSAQPMTEVTCAGLVSLLVLWIVRRDCSETKRQWGIGLLFGALVLCRPTFWPFVGLIIAERVLSRLVALNRRTASDGPSSSTALAVPNQCPVPHPIAVPWRIIVGTLLVVAPWIARNQVVIGSPIVMTTHGGYTLLLANNPEFYSEVVERGWGSEWGRASFDRWTADLLSELRAQLGPEATELDRDRWQSLRAREFIASAPGRFLRAVWYRVRCLWSPAPQGESSEKTVSTLVQLVSWYYTVVLIAFAFGVSLTLIQWLNSRHREWWPLLALVLTVQLVHLVYWTNARMRAPLVPVISLFVAATVAAAGRTRDQLAR